MSSIRAIVVDPDVPGRFVIKEVEAPQAGRTSRRRDVCSGGNLTDCWPHRALGT